MQPAFLWFEGRDTVVSFLQAHGTRLATANRRRDDVTGAALDTIVVALGPGTPLAHNAVRRTGMLVTGLLLMKGGTLLGHSQYGTVAYLVPTTTGGRALGPLRPRGHRAVLAGTQVADVTLLQHRTELAAIFRFHKRGALLEGVTITTLGSARCGRAPRGNSTVQRTVLLVTLLYLFELGTGFASVVRLEEDSTLTLGGTSGGITILAGKRARGPRAPIRDHAVLRAG